MPVADASLGFGDTTVYVQGRTVETAGDVLRTTSRLFPTIGKWAVHHSVSPIGGEVSGVGGDHVPACAAGAIGTGSGSYTEEEVWTAGHAASTVGDPWRSMR